MNLGRNFSKCLGLQHGQQGVNQWLKVGWQLIAFVELLSVSKNNIICQMECCIITIRQ